MKFTNRGVHFLVCLSLGGGFRGIRNRALIGCMLHRAVRGKGYIVILQGLAERREKLTRFPFSNFYGCDSQRPLVTLCVCVIP